MANALASICQRLGVEDAPKSRGPSLGLVRHMLGRQIWILGFAIMALGYGAQSVALHLGALNEVQPLMISELVILVFLLSFWYGVTLRPRDVASSIATATGLAVFLVVASPTAGAEIPTNARWLVVSVAIVGAMALFFLLGGKGPSVWRALSLGASASIGFALLAAITKSTTDLLTKGWGPLFSSWQLYALCVIGLTSFLIMQSAFHNGPFAASQSTLILLNPLVSLIAGHVLFGESLRSGTLSVSLEVIALAVMIVGALGLATSPLISGVHDDSPNTHLLRDRGRYARWRRTRDSAILTSSKAR